MIIEWIVGGPNDGLETKTSDLNMLGVLDGQERTADEFAALLEMRCSSHGRIIEVTPSLYQEAALTQFLLRYSDDLNV